MLSWDEELCERLAAGARFVIRYDMRDAGRSVTYEPGAPPYGLRDLVGDAIGLLDGLDWRARISWACRRAPRSPSWPRSTTPIASRRSRWPRRPPASRARSSATSRGVTDELKASFADAPPEPDWADRAAVIEYLVEGSARTPPVAPFDEAACASWRDASRPQRRHRREPDQPLPGRGRRSAAGAAGQIAAPTLVIHGTEDPLFPLGHGRALAHEIPGAELIALERTGHEYFPRGTWDLVVPAILAHTATAAA